MCMVEVIATDEALEWFTGLDAEDQEAVDFVVGLLRHQGPTLAGNHSSAIKGSRRLRELRIQSHGRPLRVFYAFDPRRDAVLLIGGDKTGDGRFYDRLIPRAEAIWAQYLTEQAAGLHDDDDDTT
jgi:hypothetical protein